MNASAHKMIVVLGPTASGKTALGCALARRFGGEVISADSRQVYRGLDIGSGKDLDQLDGVPYHLIDIADLTEEFNVFRFQRDFFAAAQNITARGRLPILVGGTGFYLEAALSETLLVEVPVNLELRSELAQVAGTDLEDRLREPRPRLHNVTDLGDRERLIRAIEIARYEAEHPSEPAPRYQHLILATDWSRAELHERIARRLRQRLANGLVEEVEGLLAAGTSPDRLRTLGLEYRFVTDYLEGRIRNRNDLFQKLLPAIKNFAKRQQTWFRRMERAGYALHRIPRADLESAAALVNSFVVRES